MHPAFAAFGQDDVEVAARPGALGDTTGDAYDKIPSHAPIVKGVGLGAFLGGLTGVAVGHLMGRDSPLVKMDDAMMLGALSGMTAGAIAGGIAAQVGSQAERKAAAADATKGRP